MLDNDRLILQQFAKSLVPELAAVAGESFGDSIDYHIDEDALTVDASPFISVLWKGRRPTRSGAKRGDPTLQESILEWIRRKGIQPNNRIGASQSDELERLSWAMSNSIHLHGTLLYRQGGKPNIFDAVITEARLDALSSLFNESYRNRITSDLFEILNKT